MTYDEPQPDSDKSGLQKPGTVVSSQIPDVAGVNTPVANGSGASANSHSLDMHNISSPGLDAGSDTTSLADGALNSFQDEYFRSGGSLNDAASNGTPLHLRGDAARGKDDSAYPAYLDLSDIWELK